MDRSILEYGPRNLIESVMLEAMSSIQNASTYTCARRWARRSAIPWAPASRARWPPRCTSWGFDEVFDTNFAADLTILEEGTELLGRLESALTGGVMEAALRTVCELVTGRELPFENLHVTPIEGLEQIKTASVTLRDTLPAYRHLEGVEVRVAVTSGLAGADRLMREIAKGQSPYHFIEVMGCPGGCVSGGGQPRTDVENFRELRSRALCRGRGQAPAQESRKPRPAPSLRDLAGRGGRSSGARAASSYALRAKRTLR